jgi:peptidyl-prolyl cis-trans isomerase D
MITWIQKTFQQHFRVVFGLLLGITIISFVIAFSPSSGLNGSARKTRSQPFFGLNLSSAEDRQRLEGDAQLSVFVQAGTTNIDPSRLQQYAYSRYASLALADQLKIPAPSQSEIADYIKAMPRFSSENGQFDPKKYSDFRDSLQHNAREGEILRVLGDNVRVERVQKLLSGPGYILPSEVKRQLALADTTWTLGIAHVDYDSYHPTINPTEAELTKYFEDNIFRYEIPRQVSLSYAEFPASAYVSQVNVTEPEVRAYYDANPARFPKAAAAGEKKPAAANPGADYAAVRPMVEATLKLEKAQRLAAKAASDFVVALFERKPAFGSADFNAFLNQTHVTLNDLPPFSEGENPPVLGANPQISEEAFRLTKDRYFSDEVATEKGSVVLFLKGSIDPRKPSFAEVRSKVAADYVEQQKSTRFVELGRTIRTQLSARLQKGEAFDKAVQAVASAENVKIDATIHPAFSLRQQPKDLDYAVFNVLEHLNKGEVSEMTRSEKKGLLVYASDKKEPNMAENSPEYQNMLAQMARSTAVGTGNAYLTELIQSELAKSKAGALD